MFRICYCLSHGANLWFSLNEQKPNETLKKRVKRVYSNGVTSDQSSILTWQIIKMVELKYDKGHFVIFKTSCKTQVLKIQ